MIYRDFTIKSKAALDKFNLLWGKPSLFSRSARSEDSNSLEMYRVPPVIINSTQNATRLVGRSYQSSTNKNTPQTASSIQPTKSRMKKASKATEDDYAIPMKRYIKTTAQPTSSSKQRSFDNLGYTGQDNDANDEDLYRKQLELFLNEAPSLTLNGVTMESPPTPEKQLHTSKGGDDLAESSRSPEYVEPTSFSPAVHKQREIQSKIIDRGPSWHQLSIIPS